jgi:hypothetical protein
VLLDNFYDRLNSLDLDFTFSDKFEDAQVHLALPHSEGKMNKHYDFVIVDEAHENYFASRVQRIIKSVGCKKQLLLTGTPSKFIQEGGYEIIAIASNEIAAEYFAKLGIELVASSYTWDNYYNQDLNINDKFDFTLEDTQHTLENVMLKLIQRIKSNLTPSQFNNPNFINSIKSWANNFKTVGKTLIVCKSIKQSNQVYQILKGHKINVAKSNSDNDKDNAFVNEFKNDMYDVLVVVNRARLGYSDDNLYNLIDMSGTHNPDLIYQMFSRVVRGNNTQQKFYIKVTSSDLFKMDLTYLSVSAALMLTDKTYLLNYNGKNFNGLEIPVLKKPKTTTSGSSGCSTGGSSDSKKVKKILPEYSLDVIDMFKNVLHNLDNPVSIYKMTTIGEVRHRLGLSETLPSGYWNDKERCAEEALKYKTKAEWQKNGGSSYNVASRNGWIAELTQHMENKIKPNGYWTKERCGQEALKYKTRGEWQKNSSASYTSASKNGWVDELCQHMLYNKLPTNYWNDKERCTEEANKYKTKSEWRKNSSSSYSAALKNGWVDDLCGHMESKRGYWNDKERCNEESIKFKTKVEWKKNSGSSYSASLRNGWIDELCSHMENKIKPNGYWTKERCGQEALKYKTKKEWKKNSSGSYKAAYRDGWLDELTQHMKKQKIC